MHKRVAGREGGEANPSSMLALLSTIPGVPQNKPEQLGSTTAFKRMLILNYHQVPTIYFVSKMCC